MAITKTQNHRGRATKNPGAEKLYQLYVVDNMTVREIAAQYEVAISTVKGWLRNADTPEAAVKQ